MIEYLFEWDSDKSSTNQTKHGISFEDVKVLWSNPNALVLYERSIDDEDRYSIVGYIDERCYTGIFTFRDEKIRIISVRRCRKKEKQRFENENNS
ncbi:MAG: BrnT family toxin [Campylobacterota bacterium]|nr:BrnT family toxin [Campylobacterota bacterium]